MSSPYNNLGKRLVRPSFAVLVFVALTSSAVRAQTPTPIGGCQPLPGAYLLKVNNSIGNFSSRQVLTLTDDGNAFVIDSNQGGVTGAFNPFTSEQGSWKCELSSLTLPSRLATATLLDFSLPGSVAGGQTIARADYQISFAPVPHTISGSIELRFFPLTANPLATPLPPPASTFTFTGLPIK